MHSVSLRQPLHGIFRSMLFSQAQSQKHLGNCVAFNKEHPPEPHHPSAALNISLQALFFFVFFAQTLNLEPGGT